MALDSNVLSQSIEQKLDELHQAAGKGPLPELGKTDRKMLFDAIARAVVEHFQTLAEVDVTNLTGDHEEGILK
jgi:hypothetical protein